jgi:hypothetical protein
MSSCATAEAPPGSRSWSGQPGIQTQPCPCVACQTHMQGVVSPDVDALLFGARTVYKECRLLVGSRTDWGDCVAVGLRFTLASRVPSLRNAIVTEAETHSGVLSLRARHIHVLPSPVQNGPVAACVCVCVQFDTPKKNVLERVRAGDVARRCFGLAEGSGCGTALQVFIDLRPSGAFAMCADGPQPFRAPCHVHVYTAGGARHTRDKK